MPLPADRELPLTTDARARLCALAETHHDFVWRAVHRLGVRGADTDDAVQQVFLVALRKLDRITPGRERSFLYGVTVRVARARRRKQRAARAEVVTPDELPAAGAAPDEAAAQRQAGRALERALDAMPEALREVFVLFEIEELSTPAIAEILELPRGTVCSRLRRAREAFRAAAAAEIDEVER